MTLGLSTLLLSACATTQQEAARLRLNSARLRAAELRLNVTRSNPSIRVEQVTVLSGPRPGAGAAVAVQVQNLASSSTSDLPILVRAREARGRTRTLNGAAGLDYFQTHLPSIAPHASLTWVFTTSENLTGAHVSAVVGSPPTSWTHVPDQLPNLEVTPTFGGRGTLRLTIRNPTSIPQYQLQVYAVVGASGQIVAAGRAEIAHLGTRTSATLTLRLLGAGTHPGIVSVQAPPTIFG